jgi:hypothetical protein
MAVSLLAELLVVVAELVLLAGLMRAVLVLVALAAMV